MAPRRDRIGRVLRKSAGQQGGMASAPSLVFARPVGGVVIDFLALGLPTDVARALGEAFWSHYGSGLPDTTTASWTRIKVFARFVCQSHAVRSVADLHTEMLARYIEWLNGQSSPNGEPWSKATRSVMYGTLRRLLQWLIRCRPGLLPPIRYPANPFPRRNREGSRRPKAPVADIRALLRACEQDIEWLRHERRVADEERRAAPHHDSDPLSSRGALLRAIDDRFGGVVPRSRVLLARGNYRCYQAVGQYGRRQVESCLYPSIDTILPYYLAILIHSAGNAQAIADLDCDCLQSVPLLEDRELMIWRKPRAVTMQRRSFRKSTAFEPPRLVRELLEWTQRLRRHVEAPMKGRLFLVKSASGIHPLSHFVLVGPLRQFESRHGLKHIAPASIRPSVLTALYRSTGDLVKVKAVANHARISTTVGYVETPEVEVQNRQRIAMLQSAFLGHIAGVANGNERPSEKPHSAPASSLDGTSNPAVSMFGFDCADPLAGIASGTRAGELCNNFLGCFSCPNALIPSDSRTLARLIQTQAHLKAAAAHVHPARWRAIYAHPLRILEEDILPRFAAKDLAQARQLALDLTPLPPLR